ncbi:MAG: flagellar motor switch protein FliG [Paraclostridium sp.]
MDNSKNLETDIVNAFDLSELELNESSGLKKAAVLLMTLGPDVSTEIIKSLPDKQIQKIGLEIAGISAISSIERRNILKEFVEINKAKDYVIEGGMEYARSLLGGALGINKASKLLEGIKHDATLKPFATARKSDTESLVNAIIEENPQTIAIVLAHIQPEKAAKILSDLPSSIQNEVAMKIGSISNIPPEVIYAIEDILEAKLSISNNSKLEVSGGIDTLVGILSNVDRKTEKSIIGTIETEDISLANQIKSSMFVFEDIVNLDNSAIQRVLKEVNMKDIAFALKGSEEHVAESIYKNQSARAADALKEEIELLGPTKISQVEESQQKIVNIVRKLESEGVIVIVRGSDNEFIM